MQDAFVTEQLVTLVITIALGCLIGISFDVLSVFRQYVRLSRALQFVIDLGFCLCMTVVVFMVLLVNNWGEVRAYVFLGLAIGAIFYLLLLHRFCRHLFVYTAEKVAALINFIARPLIWLLRKLGVLLKLFKQLFSRKITNGKKRLNKIKLKIHRKKKE